jgi:hypothetical protein
MAEPSLQILTLSAVLHSRSHHGRIDDNGPSKMPARRLNDRIYDLGAKAIKMPEGSELDEVMRDLQTGLREITLRIRHRLVSLGPERRVARQPEFTKKPHASLVWDVFHDADDPRGRTE